MFAIWRASTIQLCFKYAHTACPTPFTSNTFNHVPWMKNVAVCVSLKFRRKDTLQGCALWLASNLEYNSSFCVSSPDKQHTSHTHARKTREYLYLPALEHRTSAPCTTYCENATLIIIQVWYLATLEGRGPQFCSCCSRFCFFPSSL